MGTWWASQSDRATKLADLEGKELRRNNNSDLKSKIDIHDTRLASQQTDASSNHGDSNSAITMKAFETIRKIGDGTFGRVTLVRHKSTRINYAMKSITKPMEEDDALKKQILEERHKLLRIKHPFVVTLHYAFQSAAKLHFIFDYVSGGTLEHLIKKNKKLNEDQARFYLCEIILGLEYLHLNDVVWKDLTPHNILIDANGHIKISDMGFNKLLYKEDDSDYVRKTLEYMAPELLYQDSSEDSVDWWSVGIIFYQMIMGKSPFEESNDIQSLYKSVASAEIDIPEGSWSKHARDLLNKLLDRDSGKRLGMSCANEIMRHPFFKHINWKMVLNSDVPAMEKTELVMSPAMSEFSQIQNSKRRTESSDYGYARHISNNQHYDGFTFAGDDLLTVSMSKKEKERKISKASSEDEKLSKTLQTPKL